MPSLINIYCAIRIVVHEYNRKDATTAPDGFGTAFVVFNPANEMNYLVTSRHVVDPAFRRDIGKAVDHLEILGHYQANASSRLPLPFHAMIRNPVFTFHPDPTVDVAVVGSRNVVWLEGDSGMGLGAMSRFHFSMLPRRSELDTYLLPGESVLTAGYPGIGGQVADRPIVVQGIMSSDPRFPAAIGGDVLAHSVLCHSFSWAGMSGAPVISPLGDLGSTRLVGVNAGHVQVEGTGGGVISHFIRADRLVAILSASGDAEAQSLLVS